MPPHPYLLLLLPLLLPLSTASSPPGHESRFTTHRINRLNSAQPPVEHIAVARPLPTDALATSCTLPVFSHSFGNTTDLPPATATYIPLLNCTWSRAVVQISASCNGTQNDRIAAVWLSGVELIRTSTPQPGSIGVFWSVRKDVTRYSSILRQSNITLSVMLENAVDNARTGFYHLNISFLFYDLASEDTVNPAGKFSLSQFPSNQNSTFDKLRDNTNSHISLVLDENPADMIIPISASGDEGFWFKIQSGSDSVYQGIRIPPNTYRAVLEVYVSFHGSDETWYSNPPDSYIETNGLSTKRGHGAYREVLVKIDDNIVGSTIPFPVIYGGTINPLFWEPLASIRAFDLPSYEMELTPFLAMLLDGKAHYYGLSVADAIPYWLVNANLHLWLDDSGVLVQAGPIKYSDPNTCVERESKFRQLDGKFEIEAEKESEWSGWVYYGGGNFTTQVKQELDFESTIKFKNNGAEKEVEHEVEAKNEVKVTTASGQSVSRLIVKSKYPLKLETTTLLGSGHDNYLMTTKLEHSLEESIQDRGFESTLNDKQKCRGWVFLLDGDVLSGAASTRQRYKLKDKFGCYSRRVVAEGGSVKNETKLFLCAEDTS